MAQHLNSEKIVKRHLCYLSQKEGNPVKLCSLTGLNFFRAGSGIQGGFGKELRIVTYDRSRVMVVRWYGRDNSMRLATKSSAKHLKPTHSLPLGFLLEAFTATLIQ